MMIAMTYPTSPAATYGQWPVTSDPGDRATRADGLAATLLILGGAAGIAQLWVPWTRAVAGSPGHSGWDFFQALKLAVTGGAGFAATVGAYAILAVVVLGVAMVLLGVMMLLPLDHRPPGVVAVVAGVVAVLCALWWLFWHGGGGGIGTVFASATVGWYLFLLAGLVGTIGAIRALVGST